MKPQWRLGFVCLAALLACGGPAYAAPFSLRCQLMNSVPRSGGLVPDPPFSWHFRVDMTAGTVDGVRATLSDTRIGWAGRSAPALPTAVLLRPGWELNGRKQPDWRFHSERQIGTVWNSVDGSCVVEK